MVHRNVIEVGVNGGTLLLMVWNVRSGSKTFGVECVVERRVIWRKRNRKRK